jgi:hypothetical protein
LKRYNTYKKTSDYKEGDKVIAKYNVYNKGSKSYQLIEGKQYIVNSLFCSNYSNGIFVKGELGQPMIYYFTTFPFYTLQELRDKRIEELIQFNIEKNI